eukprot:3582657-Amphidinium_carterae.1
MRCRHCDAHKRSVQEPLRTTTPTETLPKYSCDANDYVCNSKNYPPNRNAYNSNSKNRYG